jgi:hypothetical protein
MSRILVTTASGAVPEVLRDTLEAAGHEVAGVRPRDAAAGGEGVALPTAPPDLLVADRTVGQPFVASLRQNAATAELPVLWETGPAAWARGAARERLERDLWPLKCVPALAGLTPEELRATVEELLDRPLMRCLRQLWENDREPHLHAELALAYERHGKPLWALEEWQRGLELGASGALAEQARSTIRRLLSWAQQEADRWAQEAGAADAAQQVQALEELAAFPESTARRALARALLGSDAEARQRLLNWLADSRSQWSLDVVASLLSAPDAARSSLGGSCTPDHAALRREAAQTLYHLHHPATGPALILALRDEDAGVREWAVRSLGRLNPPEAVPAFLAALDDPAGPVRYLAYQALRRSATPEALAALEQRPAPEPADPLRAEIKALFGDEPAELNDFAPLRE